MGLYTASGTRRKKADLVTTTVADPEVIINEDLYLSEPYGVLDPKPEGSKLTLAYKAGTRVRQSHIDNKMFVVATISARNPSGNLPANTAGTLVTFTGTGLDGITSVTFGGTAGTELKIISSSQLTVKVPSKTAGAVDVVFVDAEGNVTKTAFVTFA